LGLVRGLIFELESSGQKPQVNLVPRTARLEAAPFQINSYYRSAEALRHPKA
jgi:hypothetical protein